jgi:hypothetical protein
VVVICLGIVLLMAQHSLAAPIAQDATPAPTTAASYISTVPLSSGNVVLVERSWTFGDICVGGAVLLLAVINLAIAGFGLLTRWTRR